MMTDKNSLQMDMHQTAGINIDSDLSLLAEELAGLQTIMRALFIISLPALLFFTLFNYLNHRIIESMIICSMLIMMLLTYYISRHKSRCMEKQYRFYQNVFRGFLLLFIIYLFYAAGINNDLDRLQWSYIMPIIAFVSLKKKKA